MKQLSFLLSSLIAQQVLGGVIIADFNDNSLAPLGAFDPGTGQAGGLGFLTGDVWANTGTISVIPGDLSAPASTGYAVSQEPTPQSVQGTFTAGRHTTRAVETPLSGTIWFSYLLNQPTTDSRGGITFNQNASSPGNPRIVATGSEVRLGLGPTLQGAGGGADALTLGETALVLGRLIIDNNGGSETLDIWINPDVSGDVSSLPAPDTTLSEEAPSLDPGVTRVGIQSYSADGQGGILDSLRVSDAVNAFEVVTRDAEILLDDPNLAVSPLNPFAGTVATAGDSPVTVELPLDNTGESNLLTVSDTTIISGDDAGDFTILTPLPIEVAAGASAILQLQLIPSGSGRITSATLELATNDTSTPVTTIPLEARILGADGNQLFNGDFEADSASPANWLGTGNTSITEGIAPGSTFSAALAPAENLRQTVAGDTDWFLECFFQAPDTFDRAFNVLIFGEGGNINLRFQGTSDGADQTWNLFDNATLNDSWGEGIDLPPVQPGATYLLRIVGKGWDGIAPTYDLELSAPNSLAIAATASGLSRYQASVPTGAPTLLRFSTEFGNSPGFVLDDVKFINGTPPPPGGPQILDMVHDASAQTTTLTLATRIGAEYSLQASDDLENWSEIDDFTATEIVETFIENGVTSPHRFYRYLIVE